MINKYMQGETGRNPAIGVSAFSGPRDDEFLTGMATRCSECTEDTLSDQKQRSKEHFLAIHLHK
jgi:hypothetical protein